MRIRAPSGVLAVLAALIGGGCSTEPLGPGVPSPADAPIQALPDHQWAGGPVTLTSRALGALPDTILVAIDSVPQSAIRTDDSSFVTQLSDTLLSGSHVVTIVSHSDHPTVDITVAGHRTVRDLGFEFWTDAVPWPHLAPTGLLGGTGDTLTYVDLATGTTTRLGVLYNKLYGMPGVSSSPDRIILTQDDTARAYSIDIGAGTATPTSSAADGIANLDPNYWGGIDELSDSVIAFTGHDAIELDLHSASPAGSFCNISAPVNAARVVLSPSLDLAAFPARQYTCGTPSLVPIFNTRTAAVAFLIPSSSRLDAAEFSADGGTLFAITRASLSAADRTLYRVDATTGNILGGFALPPDSTDVGESHLRVDPLGPRLYGTSREGDDYVLRAWSTPSFVPAAKLRAKGAAAYCRQPSGVTSPSHLVIAPDGSQAWLAVEYCHGANDHTAVFTFDLLD